MKTFKIESPGEAIRPAIQEKIDNLNKPKGSLGVLEELAMQVCLIQQTLTPSLASPCHLLLGGDHGIEREGVSVSPREVTWQQMINFTRGGGGVNMFCRQHGFKLRIVDVGVDHDFQMEDGRLKIEDYGKLKIEDYKIAPGAKDYLYEPAMSEEEFDKAIDIGASLVDDCVAEGCRVLCIGEMGIGNTSPSSIWMSLLCDIPLDECIGAGAGLDTPGIQHKREVLHQAVAQFSSLNAPLGPMGRLRSPSEQEPSTLNPQFSILNSQFSTLPVLRYFGGFEMIAAIGAMLRAAERHIIILVDGFIMTACALGAIRLYPAAQSYMVFGHCGDESGHRRMLDAIGAKPLLSLGLRLGEGTGALCAFPILDSAVRMINEMNNFENGNITKYF